MYAAVAVARGLNNAAPLHRMVGGGCGACACPWVFPTFTLSLPQQPTFCWKVYEVTIMLSIRSDDYVVSALLWVRDITRYHVPGIS